MNNQQLKNRLRQSALTLSALPISPKDRPCQLRSACPSFIHHTAPFVMKAHGRLKMRLTPKEIDDMYYILDMLCCLDRAHRKLLWARACGVPWRALQERYLMSRTHLNMKYAKALQQFSKILETAKKLLDI